MDEAKRKEIGLPYPYIDYDEDTGVVQKMVKVDGKNYIQTRSADLSANLDHNQNLQNDGSNGYSPSRELQHVASIPLSLVEHWKKVHRVDIFNRDHDKKILQLLNDSDLRKLRTNSSRQI